MLNYKAKLVEERENDTITTVKNCIWFFIAFLLKIVNEKKRETEIEIESFLFFFQIYKKKDEDIKWIHMYYVCLLIK